MSATAPNIGNYPRSAAQQFVDVIGDSRDPVAARYLAWQLGGAESSHMSYRFRDMSAAYLTDQVGWKVKG